MSSTDTTASQSKADPTPVRSRVQVTLEASQLQFLIQGLRGDGYEVIGPRVRDGAIVYEPLESVEQLPRGWHDEQEAGRYRLQQKSDPAYFGYAVGPQSWKQFLHPSEVQLWWAERTGGSFRILNNEKHGSERFALLGTRPCELAALARLDQVLLDSGYRDPIYASRREKIFIVAVQCTRCTATCFCVSMGTGPGAVSGFDLLLTELADNKSHRFVVEVGSAKGNAVLAHLKTVPATGDDLREAEAAVAAAAEQSRHVDTTDLKDLLYQRFEHPRWDALAARCLTCANCTMVCPTCFCTTVEDMSDVGSHHAERWRRWDSCFTLSFSYIHGGSVRGSPRSRYRQWLTHKFASWHDQFGSCGCVGCGRCITWCPVGIDVTEEIRALREGVSDGNT